MAKQTFTTGQVLTAAQMTSLQQTAMGGGSPVTKTASYVLVAADAGTVIQMNSASSTTITVNTALFSAGDSVQIQNIGAGVCTITAGTATVNTAGSLALTQWEGGFLYFTSASSAIFFDIVQSSGMTNPMTTNGDTIYGGASGTPTRLGIGSTGQVLTVNGGVPSWATPTSSGGMTLISTTTLSGTSVTLSSIPSTYKHLLLTFSSVTTNSNSYFTLKPNNASNCNYQSWDMGNSTGTTSSYASSAFYFNTNTAVNSSSVDNAGSLWIYDYSSTTLRKNLISSFGYSSPSSVRAAVNVGLCNTTSAISSIVFDAGGNTFTAGTLLLYGVS